MPIEYDYKIGAGGATVPFTSGITHLVTGLTPATSYDFYVRARDTATGLASVWVGPETVVTESGVSSMWDGAAPANWSEDPTTFDRTGTLDTYAAVEMIALPKFNNVGEYVEMELLAGAAVLNIRDASKTISIGQDGTVTMPDHAQQNLAAYGVGDVVRVTKINATQFKYQVNGGADQNITQALTGECETYWGVQTVTTNSVANPVSNI